MTLNDLLKKDFPYSETSGLSLEEYKKHSEITILLVDDSEQILKMLVASVKKLGYTIVGATTSDFEAIELWENYHPNIVTIDVNLINSNNGNCINGNKLAEKFITFNHSAKILFISAIEQDDMNNIVLDIYSHHKDDDINIDYILSKSPKIEDLKSTLEELVNE